VGGMTEPKRTVTIGVTATRDSTFDQREEGAQVTVLQSGDVVLTPAVARRRVKHLLPTHEVHLQRCAVMMQDHIAPPVALIDSGERDTIKLTASGHINVLSKTKRDQSLFYSVGDVHYH
jgi:hypothetical protein